MFYVIVIVFSSVLAFYNANSHPANKEKREIGGSLHIQTNHASPIHADVKPEKITEKPCPPSNNIPAHIENGVGFQVTPPQDAVYEPKSLRKSLYPSNRYDLVRSINRVVTLAVLLVAVVIEFYPLLKHLHHLLYTFIQ